MQQVFFRLPFVDWPIFGYGLMLFLAFIACTWLAGRRGERVGMTREMIQDFTIWVFVGGLLGARIFFLCLERETPPGSVLEFLYELPRIWEGGIIFYGSVVGALAAYVLLYWFSLSQEGRLDAPARRRGGAVAGGRVGAGPARLFPERLLLRPGGVCRLSGLPGPFPAVGSGPLRARR